MNVLTLSSWRHLRLHPWQFAMGVLGIALGVAVVVSINLVQASAQRALALSLKGVVGTATHQVVAGPQGIDERLYARLKRRPGLPALAPVVRTTIVLPAHGDTRLTLLGLDPFAERAFRGYAAAGTGRGAELRRLLVVPGAVLLAKPLALRLGLAVGDRLTVLAGTRRTALTIAGWLAPAASQPAAALNQIAVADIATVQEALDRPGRLSAIDVRVDGDPVVADATLRALKAALPPDLGVVSTAAQGAAARGLTRAFYTNLRALSLFALLVGMFLIYNTETFLVVQRRELIGLLRALGVTRGEIRALVLGEALVLGTLGTGLGIVLGAGLAAALLHLVARTLNDLYFAVAVTRLDLDPVVLAIAFVLGLGATLVAAAVPALEAAGVAPRAALQRSVLEHATGRRLPWLAAGGLGAILFGTTVLVLSRTSMVSGFAGLFAILFGCALLTPACTVLLAKCARPLLNRLLGLTGDMACGAVVAGLSRTGVAVAALMLAVSIATGIGLMVASFRTTVADWLASVLRADVYVSAANAGDPFSAQIDPALVRRLEALPSVTAVSHVRRVKLTAPDGVTRLAAYRFNPRARSGFRFRSGSADAVWKAFETEGAVIVSEPYAWHHHVRVGDKLHLRTARGDHAFAVAGIYQDYGSDQGTVAMSRATYEQWFDDRGISGIGVYGRPGESPAKLMKAVQQVVGTTPGLEIEANRRLRETSLAVFDRTFAITSVMRTLAAVIACAGVLGALMALVLERQREYGILRAIGFTPAQLAQLIVTETGLLGLIAGLLALPTGILVAALLVDVINRRSFGWTMDLHVSPIIACNGLLMAILSALVAGAYPAWRIARMAPATALRTE